MPGRIVMRFAVVVGASMWLAPTAPAATVYVGDFGEPVGAAVVFAAAPGEINDVTVTGDSLGISLHDSQAVLEAGNDCSNVDAHTVRCVLAVPYYLQVRLEDGADRITIEESAYGNLGTSFGSAAFVAGGTGDDVIRTGSGRDDVLGNAGSDDIAAGAGDDFITTGFIDEHGDDIADGGPGSDYVWGGPGDDVLSGGAGGDEIVNGEAGRDLVEGGDGADSVVGGPGDDRVSGGAGDDALEFEDFLFDERFAVRSQGSDDIDGGAGDDRIGTGLQSAAREPDIMRGGAGVDVVDYSLRSDSVVADLEGDSDDGAAGEGDSIRADVESLIGGRSSDTLVGSDAANTLDGRQGDDLLSGLGGDDVLDGSTSDAGSDGLEGGPGADTLRGGPGDDSLDGGDGDDGLAAGGGADTLQGGAGQDRLAGGPGLDSLDAGEGDDVLYGGDVVLVGADAADTLHGGGGDDTLVAGAGNDLLDGGTGADRIAGEAGRDTVTYESRGADVTVTLDDRADDGEPGEGDRITTDVEVVVGGALGDTLSGDASANTLDGGSGEDYLDGGRGTDALAGGTATDVIRSRDGSRDLVSCGDAADLVIADPRDTVRDCEFVDRGGPRRRLPLDAAEVNPTQGKVTFRIPGAQRRTPLRDDLLVPEGTTLDVRFGRLRLAAARNARGSRQAATLYGGQFSVVERGRRRPVTELTLRGGTFAGCPSGEPGKATAAATRRVRRLWGRAGRTKGRFRTRGRWSTATVRGTVWLVEDRCDGTLTRVISGTVDVRDHVRDVTVTVDAGDSYLARAPGAD